MIAGKVRMRFKHYIFDWGDTLMVDFPEAQGPMYLWEKVAAVPGALETLAVLHRQAGCYLATNAQDSKEQDIVRALERVGLAEHLDGVFCFDNLGCCKPSAAFFESLLARIGADPRKTVMVGDSLETDIAGALVAGLHGLWFNPDGREGRLAGAGEIRSLKELIKPAA